MKFLTFLVLFTIIMYTSQRVIHIQFQGTEDEQKQLELLMAKQSQFLKSINEISDALNALLTKINSTSNTSNDTQKINLLENSIIKQRKDLYNLEILLLPNFTSIKNICSKNLSSQQNNNLSSDVSNIKNNILQFQKVTQTFPRCDKIQYIRDDLQKQLFFTQVMQTSLSPTCSSKIPTIGSSLLINNNNYQSNLQAQNWILGTQTYQELMNSYKNKVSINKNIVNCTLDRPFFNGVRCVKCSKNSPIFDMSINRCTNCPELQNLDTQKHICIKQQYNSNFVGTNFLPGSNSLPPLNPKLKICPFSKPFFNGTDCINCQSPFYFSISKNKCDVCQSEYIYNINSKACEKPIKGFLTQFNQSQWVTNQQINKIFRKRQQQLNSDYNNSLKICPPEKPYYDNMTCVNCTQPTPYFYLDKLICIPKPTNLTYNPNVYFFVEPDVGYETSPKANNIISKSAIPDNPNLKNCNDSAPFYDGISCINCNYLNPIFNSTSKKCTKCPEEKYYIKSLLDCGYCKIQYEQIYSYQNRTCEYKKAFLPNLSVGKFVNLTDTFEKIKLDEQKRRVTNPNVTICPKQSPYSNQDSCFACPENSPIFNFTSKSCTKCLYQQIYDSTEFKCLFSYPSIYFTNFEVDNIVDLPDPISKILQTQKLIQDQNPKAKKCPIQTPFFNTINCISCPTSSPLFNYTSMNCTQCDTNQFQYNNILRKCYDKTKTLFLTDLNTKNVANMIGNLSIQQNNSKKIIQSNPKAKLCQNPTPYSNGINCVGCDSNTPYFDFTNLKCINCGVNQTFSVKVNKCLPNNIKLTNFTNTKVVNLPNTFENINKDQNNTLNQNEFAVMCPPQKPYSTNYQCISCGSQQVYNFTSKQCNKCPNQSIYNPTDHICSKIIIPFLVNIANTSNIVFDGIPLKQYLSKNQKLLSQNPNIQNCPPENPYFNNITCISCSEPKPYFNLHLLICIECEKNSKYNKVMHECEIISQNYITQKPTIQKMLASIF